MSNVSVAVDPSRPERISLAYRELTHIPQDVVQKYKDSVTELDLSHNQFTLETLWVNHNSISNLSVFIETVAKSFPKLKYLSMMDNQAAPSYFNGGTYAQYKDYRLFVISHMPNLVVLDDEVISNQERENARQVYGSRRYSVHTKRKHYTKTKEKKSR